MARDVEQVHREGVGIQPLVAEGVTAEAHRGQQHPVGAHGAGGERLWQQRLDVLAGPFPGCGRVHGCARARARSAGMAQDIASHLQRAAGLHHGGAGDLGAIDEGAIGRVEIGDDQLTAVQVRGGRHDTSKSTRTTSAEAVRPSVSAPSPSSTMCPCSSPSVTTRKCTRSSSSDAWRAIGEARRSCDRTAMTRPYPIRDSPATNLQPRQSRTKTFEGQGKSQGRARQYAGPSGRRRFRVYRTADGGLSTLRLPVDAALLNNRAAAAVSRSTSRALDPCARRPAVRGGSVRRRRRPMRKPSNIIFGVDERPTLGELLASDMQHVGLLSIYLIYPSSSPSAGGLSRGQDPGHTQLLPADARHRRDHPRAQAWSVRRRHPESGPVQRRLRHAVAARWSSRADWRSSTT